MTCQKQRFSLLWPTHHASHHTQPYSPRGPPHTQFCLRKSTRRPARVLGPQHRGYTRRKVRGESPTTNRQPPFPFQFRARVARPAPSSPPCCLESGPSTPGRPPGWTGRAWTAGTPRCGRSRPRGPWPTARPSRSFGPVWSGLTALHLFRCPRILPSPLLGPALLVLERAFGRKRAAPCMEVSTPGGDVLAGPAAATEQADGGQVPCVLPPPIDLTTADDPAAAEALLASLGPEHGLVGVRALHDSE